MKLEKITDISVQRILVEISSSFDQLRITCISARIPADYEGMLYKQARLKKNNV